MNENPRQAEGTAPLTRLGRNALDNYERQYMSGNAIFRERVVVSPVALAMVFVLEALSIAGQLWPIATTCALVTYCVLFGVLRISVDKRSLTAHFGWRHRSIPLASIEAVVATMRGGVLETFAPPLSPSRGITVVYSSRTDGRRRHLVLASRDPQRLARAVRLAQENYRAAAAAQVRPECPPRSQTPA